MSKTVKGKKVIDAYSYASSVEEFGSFDENGWLADDSPLTMIRKHRIRRSDRYYRITIERIHPPQKGKRE